MILVIDDDQIIRSSLELLLTRAKYSVMTAANPQAALEIIRRQSLQLILMDMNFSINTTGEEGLVLLKQAKIFQPKVPVILMTAWGSIDLAVKGMREGAFDFITKPWNNPTLLQHIENALILHSPDTNDSDEALKHFSRSFIIGKSKQLDKVFHTIARIAPTDAAVLITGESGTGKELIAEAIHLNSKRKKENLVKVNLGGLSPTLFESEMFGHKKGAFTNAYNDRPGRFEVANKGTLFLDEIGELDLSCQVKLLRVLQDQTYEMVGDSRTRKADVRIVCATNANLWQMVSEKRFREDLFYRINLITVHLPALRERKEDIPLLTDYFIEKQRLNYQLPPVHITDEAYRFLESLPYPGNIRELKNLVERTLLVSTQEVITAKEFEQQYVQYSPSKQSAQSLQGLTLDELEKQAIHSAIEQHEYNISQTASALGISRGALYRKLDKYNIPLSNNKTDDTCQ